MSGSVDLGGRRIIKKIFFKQKTAYEIVTGDWSSDVCSSDLRFSSIIVGKHLTVLRPKHFYIVHKSRSEERRVGKECER